MGRHWEKLDNGYNCYSGFLHVEASKSIIDFYFHSNFTTDTESLPKMNIYLLK